MRFIKRIFSTNFWYKVSLGLTIWSTLKKTNEFNKIDIKNIKKRYYQIIKVNKGFIDDVLSEYHIAWCSIILAIYEISKNKGYEKNKSIDITEKVIFINLKPEVIANYVKQGLEKAKDKFTYMVNCSKNQEKNFFGSTFTFYREIDDNNSYHLRVNKCFYYDFFVKNKSPELMKIACKWDMISWTTGIIPEIHHITFKRPVTIGLENKDCEFDFDRII